MQWILCLGTLKRIIIRDILSREIAHRDEWRWTLWWVGTKSKCMLEVVICYKNIDSRAILRAPFTCKPILHMHLSLYIWVLIGWWSSWNIVLKSKLKGGEIWKKAKNFILLVDILFGYYVLVLILLWNVLGLWNILQWLIWWSWLCFRSTNLLT